MQIFIPGITRQSPPEKSRGVKKILLFYAPVAVRDDVLSTEHADQSIPFELGQDGHGVKPGDRRIEDDICGGSHRVNQGHHGYAWIGLAAFCQCGLLARRDSQHRVIGGRGGLDTQPFVVTAGGFHQHRTGADGQGLRRKKVHQLRGLGVPWAGILEHEVGVFPGTQIQKFIFRLMMNGLADLFNADQALTDDPLDDAAAILARRRNGCRCRRINAALQDEPT